MAVLITRFKIDSYCVQLYAIDRKGSRTRWGIRQFFCIGEEERSLRPYLQGRALVHLNHIFRQEKYIILPKPACMEL